MDLFGWSIHRPDLAEIVNDLYDAALKQSSKRTYKTGQRAYFRFLKELPATVSVYPFPRQRLQRTELMLAFYMAWNLIRPTISASSTVLGYETHVKYLFRSEGCHPDEFNTAFLGQIRAGIKKSLPCAGDKRAALILPRYIRNIGLGPKLTKKMRKLRFATIVGFIGMLRPHTYTQLKVSSFSIVLLDDTCITLNDYRKQLLRRSGNTVKILDILGYYISFESKTMKCAKAYYPNLTSLRSSIRDMCPVTALLD